MTAHYGVLASGLCEIALPSLLSVGHDVILAIVFDRISQSLGEKRAMRGPSLLETVRSLFSLRAHKPPAEAERAG